jgi:2-polyprenyl-3-methyl-5-hydroxy-6-metoxy-1,4-benzoquinol methylase
LEQINKNKMGLYRHAPTEKTARVHLADTKDMTEWSETNIHNYTSGRLEEKAWKERYEHEANIVSSIINKTGISKILELGPGPGVLAQEIYKKSNHNLDYHLIDKPVAKQIFEEKRYKGKFFVKDMSEGLDIEGLDEEYHMIMANDFLEHVFNPSHIMRQSHKLLIDRGLFFVSVPNWRMGHNWIYRGLFDYDNWRLFMEYHNFKFLGEYKSNLVCSYSPKLDSESLLPDELIQSWNWYMLFEKISV